MTSNFGDKDNEEIYNNFKPGSFFCLFWFQLTFFIKRDSEGLTTDETPAFLTELQNLGVTLDSYNGAYNNNSHPNAVETAAQYDHICEGLQQSAKRTKLDDDTSFSTPNN